ncbi:MAG: hypothetical protein NXI30_20705 [bacterium]|nr:hypothetical protein [bacterium]
MSSSHAGSSIRGIRESLRAALGDRLVEAFGIGRERSRVAHHDLEALDAFEARDEGA